LTVSNHSGISVQHHSFQHKSQNYRMLYLMVCLSQNTVPRQFQSIARSILHDDLRQMSRDSSDFRCSGENPDSRPIH